MTTLIGRSVASLRAGARDPGGLGSAIAKHAHCALGARNGEVEGMHNGVHGTSAGDAVGADAAADAVTGTATATVSATAIGHGYGNELMR